MAGWWWCAFIRQFVTIFTPSIDKMIDDIICWRHHHHDLLTNGSFKAHLPYHHNLHDDHRPSFQSTWCHFIIIIFICYCIGFFPHDCSHYHNDNTNDGTGKIFRWYLVGGSIHPRLPDVGHQANIVTEHLPSSVINGSLTIMTTMMVYNQVS